MGLIAGVLVFFLVAGITGQFILDDFKAGIPPALAASLWVAMMLKHREAENLSLWLFPAPTVHEIPHKKAFSLIKQVITEYYSEKDHRFSILPIPANKEAIKAHMKWVDFENQYDFTSEEPLKSKRQSVERRIRLEVYFKAIDDSTKVTMNWYPVAEGRISTACDQVVNEVTEKIYAVLGPGEAEIRSERPWIPPRWLHILTILCILLYVFVALCQLGNSFHRYSSDASKSSKASIRSPFHVSSSISQEWLSS